jgi:DNA-binding SARP family transcriptional activator
MKGLVYRLQQAFSLISEHRLIKSTTNGYQINPELNIITDIQQFDHKLCSALNAFSNAQKTELLKKAVDLYEGDLLTSASAEHWLMSASVNYQHRYVGAVTELMKALEHDKQYRCMQIYASKALTIVPIDPGLYFWLIHSLHKQGHTGIARSELHAAKIKLLEEDYADLLEHLQHVGFDAKRSYHTFFSPVGTLIDPMGY